MPELPPRSRMTRSENRRAQRHGMPVSTLHDAWSFYQTHRGDLVPIATFAGATAAIIMGLMQLRVARKRHYAQTQADFQRRITESFTKAVEQLGSDKLQVRLGGIYALERISRESPDDYWTVMETLTAFVREQARWKEPDRAELAGTEARNLSVRREHAAERRPASDIAAVLTVVARRSPENRAREKREGLRLDLRSTDLRGASLSKAHLEGAELDFAHLEGAHLRDACLQSAFLVGAHLERATLVSADLSGAVLWDAHLQGAKLYWVDFGASSSGGGAINRSLVRGAHVEGTDLSETRGLSTQLVASMKGDAETILPAGVDRPDHWPK